MLLKLQRILSLLVILAVIAGGIFIFVKAENFFDSLASFDPFRPSTWLAAIGLGDDDTDTPAAASPAPNTTTAGEGGTDYIVTFVTDDDGTDANITVILVGANGQRTKPVIVNEFMGSVVGESAFEVNDADVVTLVDRLNVGLPRQLILASDNAGPGPQWSINRVEVTDEASQTAFFYPERPIGGSFPGELTLYSSPERNEYTISIKTGDNGTDSDILLTLVGTQGSKSIELNQLLEGNALEAGDLDQLTLQPDKSLGELEWVFVELDELTAFSDSWTPEYIQVNSGPTTWRAKVNREIIDKDSLDGEAFGFKFTRR